MRSDVCTGSSQNHFRRWRPGWPRSAGSGRLTWMLSNVTSTAWISQRRQKVSPRKAKAPQSANTAKEIGNENQTDHPVCGRSGEGTALLYRGAGLYQEGRFQQRPLSLADGGLGRGAEWHRAAASVEQQPRG